MKAVIKITLFFVSIFLIMYLLVVSLPLGSRKYNSKKTELVLIVPSYSSFDFEEFDYAFKAHFKSVRTKHSLEKEIERILKSYEKIECDNNTYYYDKKQNFTILSYDIKGGLIFNEFFLEYTLGEHCFTLSKNFEIEVKESKEPDTKQLIYPEISAYVKPLNYKLFSHGVHEIKITVDGVEFLLEEALRLDKITIEALISKIEDESYELGNGPDYFDDGGSIYMKGEKVSILKCNTLMGNTDIYIGSTDMGRKKGFCE